MPTLENSGTQTAVINTEHTLETNTTNKTFVFIVDTGNMVNGDVLELRIYYIVLAAGTERLAYYACFQHAQSEPQKISLPVPSDVSCKFTLKQTAGTSRNFAWKVLSL